MHSIHRPHSLRRFAAWRPWLLSLALALGACGGGGNDEPVAPVATVTSITVSLPSARVDVGQSLPLVAEARDQGGAVMAGVAFTWASSNTDVVAIGGGLATGVAAGTASIVASSGGVNSTAATLSVVAAAAPVGSIVVDKPALYLAGIGQSASLGAQILDAQGAPSAGSVTWASSAPDKVSVDASGRVQALAIGSAQIVATSGGLHSAPALVVVAQPRAGAVLVTDAQVVSVGMPLPVAAGGRAQYEVTLTNLPAPAIGTLMIAAESAPVAGKVLATRQEAAGLVVTLRLASLNELFSDYDIRFDLDLAAFGVDALPSTAATKARSLAWSREQHAHALSMQRRLGVFDPFKAWTCDATIKAKLLAAPIHLSLENKLRLVLEDRPGYSKHAIEGSADIVGSAGLKMDAGFAASGQCDAQGQIKLPVFGWVSMIVMPAVRFGIGAELKSEVLLVQGELSVEGSIGFKPVVGWECGGAQPSCRGLSEIPLTDKFKVTSKIPSKNDMQAKISAQFYAIAGLDASIFLGLGNAQIVEARIGPKQSFDLGFEEDQAARPDFAASYDLKLDGVIQPGSALQKAIEAVIGDDATAVKFEATFTAELAESPKGTLSISKAKVRPDAPVDFTVDLDAKTVAYGPLGYNVVGVELYRRREGESDFTSFKFMDLIATTRATYRWVPTAADAGKYEFAALVQTAIDVPLLEVTANSIQLLEVSCFAGAQAIGPARAHALAAPGGAPDARRQALVCVDSWAGTATYVAKTPGLAAANITSHSNVTWTVDPALSNQYQQVYTPKGTFDLAFNDPVNGCSFTLSPNVFTIVDQPMSPARLAIYQLPFAEPTYGIGGVQLVDITVTSSCPGREDVVTVMNGFQVTYAYGTGPYTGQAQLSGSIDDAATTSHWDFSRP